MLCLLFWMVVFFSCLTGCSCHSLPLLPPHHHCVGAARSDTERLTLTVKDLQHAVEINSVRSVCVSVCLCVCVCVYMAYVCVCLRGDERHFGLGVVVGPSIFVFFWCGAVLARTLCCFRMTCLLSKPNWALLKVRQHVHAWGAWLFTTTPLRVYYMCVCLFAHRCLGVRVWQEVA